MVLHLKRFLVLTLLCLASVAHADVQRLQALHELRSEGYTASTYLLIDNNLFERIREPGNKETYVTALAEMSRLISQMGNPDDLRTLFANFETLTSELQDVSGDEAHYNLATVNRIMQAHGQFDRLVATRYEQAAEGITDEILLTLNQQSIETSQILTLYQNNMFSSVGIYFLDNQDGLFDMLDKSITQRAAKLRTLIPEQAETFGRLERQYAFIQPRLQNPLENWVPTIAAFYLQRNIQTLNNLAREQGRAGR
ncbi:MAG: hypothetical protein ACK4VV_03880 [Pseudomonas sp.]